MPLRGIINGEDIIAPFLDDDEWNQLKNRVKSEKLDVRIPCCGNPAYLRTSKHGFHHFVHKKRGDCTSKPESWQHLKAKQEIVRACRAAGYDAKTEIEGEGWRADVLAIKGNARIAFEVQWSSQTWDITQERQQKFTDAGVRGCWFFKTPPPGYRAHQETPLFKLEISDDDCNVVFNPQSYYDWQEDEHKTIRLSEFTTALLTRRIKFCEVVTSQTEQKLEIQFIKRPCWKCGAFYDVYQVVNSFESGCGQRLIHHMYMYNPDSDLNFAFHPEIKAAVSDYVSKSTGFELANFTRYFRKETTTPLDAFQCPHCDALLGHKYLMETYHADSPKDQTVTLSINFKNPPVLYEADEDIGPLHGHWCFPAHGDFCCT